MNRYWVRLAQTCFERTEVEVEAENEEQAEKLALEKSVDSEWRSYDVMDREVIAVEKL